MTQLCANCSKKNPEEALFCQQCGSPLMQKCASCGMANALAAKSCAQCGLNLEIAEAIPGRTQIQSLRKVASPGLREKIHAAGVELGGERKPVTILFTDIVGSAGIAEGLDPEAWREIVAGVHRCIAQAVYRYEGTIAQLLGDGVLAFFGAPLNHEDDPARACHAGLDILTAIGEYQQDLGASVENLQVRVGINTGEVVIGDIGTDLHVEYLAFGDAVNLAARLEAAAEPGTILIGESTYRLVSPAFEMENLGPTMVRGREEAIDTFRVLAPKTHPRKLRGVEGLESELVGREDEFDALLKARDRLSAGEGWIVTITGEAGIGKSRLVAEYHKEAINSALEWMEGCCVSYGGSIPYLLWVDIFQTVFGLLEEDSPSKMLARMRETIRATCGNRSEDVSAYLGRLLSLPLDAEVAALQMEMDGGEIRSGIFRAVEVFLECMATAAPLVLVCDDLHWADPSSMELLQAVLGLTERVPLGVVCVYRPEKAHASWQLAEHIARDYADRHTHLELVHLSDKQSEDLVDNLVGLEAVPRDLKDRILSRAEGNPFYVEEIFRSLKDDGILIQEKLTGKWEVIGDMKNMEIPDTLQGVLLARIDRLQEETKRVLQMASVIGRIFLYRVLSAIAGMERELDNHLEALITEEMVRERVRIPELEYIFKHQLAQEAAYNTLLKKERSRYHKMVAQSLEELFPDRIEEILGVLAHHWERADSPEQAVEFLQRAGDRARLAYAPREAADYYERAIRILKERDQLEHAARMLMRLGLTHLTAFEFKQSQTAYQEAFEIRQHVRRIRPASSAPAPHPYRFFWPETPPLNPPYIPTYETGMWIRNMFSGLVELGVEGEILPDVAERWEVSEDGRKYVFHLREDAKWSDGQRLTAEDFEYSFMLLLKPDAEAASARDLFVIRNARAFHQGEIADYSDVGISAESPTILEVELASSASHFLYLMAHTIPVPKHVVRTKGESWASWENMVTNGPFMPGKFPPDEPITLVRNPNYHGRFPGNLEEAQITVTEYRRQSTEFTQARLDQYRKNHIDIFAFGEQISRIRNQFADEYQSELIPGLWFFALDPSRPPFHDTRVRRAFALALDKGRMAEEVPRAYIYPANGGFIPPGIPGHSPGIAMPFDPERARQLLADAGYPGGKGFPALQIVWVAENKKLERLLAQWRENLNVEISMEIMKYEEAMGEIRKREIYHMGWRASILDPDNFLRVCIREGLPSWEHKAYEELIQKANNTLDQEERIHLYQSADKMLIEEAVAIPIDYAQAHFLVKPWVKIPVGRIEYTLLKDIVIEPH